MKSEPDIIILDHISLIRYVDEKCEKKQVDFFNKTWKIFNTTKRINNRKNKIENVFGS